ncbi:MAG: tRNA preQ1(34) S-adenosylmethionine ribosyltransferase-isomerase QueA [Methylocystis sp.]|uniref:tRNA preQ1(34) S-adenosylmethionine ribosyltransferase-isomerase QueA n=1 Tax=Methylocystis sp. TaxID=1911079 RepID=UPI00393977F1
MRVDLFDFELPADRIALRPASPRDSARMLVAPSTGDFEDRRVLDLPDYLQPGDALVANDSRVIHARLAGRRLRGELSANVEATLIERLDALRWRALMRPAKKLSIGDRVRFVGHGGELDACVEAKGDDGEIMLAFELHGPALDAAIEQAGVMPLPPYIAGKRAADARDETDYQTMFAREAGAVAAPTAGLHFTPQLLEAIDARGVSLHRVTLHVGAGTFLPVKAEDTDLHRMHEEFARVDAATAQALNDARAKGGRIIPVGTTALRVLESAADDAGRIIPYANRTGIFITPGYRFRAVDMLLTNFHLPRSTLFMLVAAFAGLERMKSAYAHAIESDYRFYSYGDACLLERCDT